MIMSLANKPILQKLFHTNIDARPTSESNQRESNKREIRSNLE